MTVVCENPADLAQCRLQWWDVLKNAIAYDGVECTVRERHRFTAARESHAVCPGRMGLADGRNRGVKPNFDWLTTGWCEHRLREVTVTAANVENRTDQRLCPHQERFDDTDHRAVDR